jgi:TIR domain
LSNTKQDVFISHASADKEKYILPLTNSLSTHGVTFWLDNNEIRWGDNIVTKINDGLSKSRFGLICLSKAFVSSPWTEGEMSAILGMQYSSGEKKLIPLILNSKELVLKTYPLLSSIAYRDFSLGPAKLADQLSELLRLQEKHSTLTVIVEGFHTGKLCRIDVPKRATVHWLIKCATASLDVTTDLKVSDFASFHVRWVPVDTRLEKQWKAVSRNKKRRMHAMLLDDDNNIISCENDGERFSQFKLSGEIVLHLYAVEDEAFDNPLAAAAP